MKLDNKNAFSLIEIMLVLVIISIIAAMALPNIMGQGKKARIKAARADIDANLSTALDLYELDSGRYPSTEQGLAALIQEPTSPPQPKNWGGPYLKKKRIPRDPWGEPYVYMSPGEHNTTEYDLYSYGPDGVQSDDDIVNWEDEFSLED